ASNSKTTAMALRTDGVPNIELAYLLLISGYSVGSMEHDPHDYRVTARERCPSHRRRGGTQTDARVGANRQVHGYLRVHQLGSTEISRQGPRHEHQANGGGGRH